MELFLKELHIDASSRLLLLHPLVDLLCSRVNRLRTHFNAEVLEALDEREAVPPVAEGRLQSVPPPAAPRSPSEERLLHAWAKINGGGFQEPVRNKEGLLIGIALLECLESSSLVLLRRGSGLRRALPCLHEAERFPQRPLTSTRVTLDSEFHPIGPVRRHWSGGAFLLSACEEWEKEEGSTEKERERTFHGVERE